VQLASSQLKTPNPSTFSIPLYRQKKPSIPNIDWRILFFAPKTPFTNHNRVAAQPFYTTPFSLVLNNPDAHIE